MNNNTKVLTNQHKYRPYHQNSFFFPKTLLRK